MKTSSFLSLYAALLLVAAVGANKAHASAVSRDVENFDAGWRFLKSDAPGAEAPQFDDSSWRPQSLPHDWSIEGPFEKTNPATGAGAFLPGGIGWYRKQFRLPFETEGKRVFLEFDGVMANSDVWINGFLLGHRPYGYVSFGYELTGHLHFGNETNVVAVRADDASQPASRWYAGAGIYRHVRLVVTDRLHIERWSTFVTTPQVSAQRATVHVRTVLQNQGETEQRALTRVVVIAPDGRPAGSAFSAVQAISPGKSAEYVQDIVVERPSLWGLNSPTMYRAIVSVDDGSSTIDDEVTPFGIREFHFDSATGFSLNGENLKLKGVCLHSDGSAFGAAVPASVWELRLAALKRIGANAIRTAHNPPSPEFLDLCDRMGFLVMDESFDCWMVAKNPYDYHLYFNEWSKTDARDMVLRDRNHPSIILWSSGNEIHDTPQTQKAKTILSGLVAVFHEYDPTRPVTQALFRPNVSHDYDDGLADMLDVIGTNYRFNELIAAQIAKPSRKIVGTENGHELPSWLAVRDTPSYSGEFIWSGIDYLGEAQVWPSISRPTGLLDRLAHPHADGSIAQSWWSDTPMVYVARRVAPTPPRPTDPGYEGPTPLRRLVPVLYSDWTPRSSEAHEENVEVYSNCQSVELFLNGSSLGAQPINPDLTPRRWKVPYASGQLRAVGTNSGTVVASQELKTAGEPVRLVLSAECAQVSPSWEDIDVITARVVDAQGTLVPHAKNSIHFTVEGAGAIVAVDSADNVTSEPFQASDRRAYEGECVAFVRATGASGPILVSATSDRLEGGSIPLSAVPNSAEH